MKLQSKAVFLRLTAVFLALFLGCMLVFAGCGGGDTPGGDNGSDNGNEGQTDGDSDGDDPDEGGTDLPQEEPDYYVRADKDVYYKGENIYVVAGGGDASWVGVFHEDADPAVAAPAVQYSVNQNSMRSGMRYVITENDGLDVGDYKIVLFADAGTESVEAQAEVSVVEQAAAVNKTVFRQGEDIVVTAVGSGNSWVGLYREGETPGSGTTSICWYYIDRDKCLSGQSYILQRTAEYNRSGYSSDTPFPAGNYKVVLFANENQSSVVEEIPIQIVSGSAGTAAPPASATYELDEPGSGKAGGTLTLTFDEADFNASEVVAYWANDRGILSDYEPFAPQKVTGRVMKFAPLDNVMIPAEATCLRFYGKNVNGLGEEYYELMLPEGSAHTAGKLLFEMNVVSDLHISTSTSHNGKPDVYNPNFLNACEDIVAVSPNSEAMVIVGDIANSGLLAEWAMAEEIMYSVDGIPAVYYTIGNHDLYEPSTPYAEKIHDFLRYSGQEKVYYEASIGGMHHLVLGSQAQHTNNASPSGGSGLVATMYDDQLDWLEERLAAISAESPGEPIFVYCHQSMYDTIAGSLKDQDWNGIRSEDEENLRAILAKYPQVFLFNGHSHWIMESYRNAYFASNQLPNIFNTSSVGYLWSTTDKEVSVDGSQGYFVRVYENEVLVLGRDFAQHKWIPSACYVVSY